MIIMKFIINVLALILAVFKRIDRFLDTELYELKCTSKAIKKALKQKLKSCIDRLKDWIDRL